MSDQTPVIPPPGEDSKWNNRTATNTCHIMPGNSDTQTTENCTERQGESHKSSREQATYSERNGGTHDATRNTDTCTERQGETHRVLRKEDEQRHDNGIDKFGKQINQYKTTERTMDHHQNDRRIEFNKSINISRNENRPIDENNLQQQSRHYIEKLGNQNKQLRMLKNSSNQVESNQNILNKNIKHMDSNEMTEQHRHNQQIPSSEHIDCDNDTGALINTKRSMSTGRSTGKDTDNSISRREHAHRSPGEDDKRSNGVHYSGNKCEKQNIFNSTPVPQNNTRSDTSYHILKTSSEEQTSLYPKLPLTEPTEMPKMKTKTEDKLDGFVRNHDKKNLDKSYDDHMESRDKSKVGKTSTDKFRSLSQNNDNASEENSLKKLSKNNALDRNNENHDKKLPGKSYDDHGYYQKERSDQSNERKASTGTYRDLSQNNDKTSEEDDLKRGQKIHALERNSEHHLYEHYRYQQNISSENMSELKKNKWKTEYKNADNSTNEMTRNFTSDGNQSTFDEDQKHHSKYLSNSSENNEKTLSKKHQSKSNYKADFQKLELQISPMDLATSLANVLHFKESLINLAEHQNINPRVVKQIASDNPHIFTIYKDFVELKPAATICCEYNSDRCSQKKQCQDLHICQKYLIGSCKSKMCQLGHRWDTGHNDAILNSLSIQHLHPDLLTKLFCPPNLDDFMKITFLIVCIDYNNNKCNSNKCDALHICYNIVKNLKCEKNVCSLNHDILDPSCVGLLKAVGISTNESPRDIIALIKEKIQHLTSDNDEGDSDDDQDNNKKRNQARNRKSTENNRGGYRHDSEHKNRDVIHSSNGNGYPMNAVSEHNFDMYGDSNKKYKSHLSSQEQPNHAYGSSFQENYKQQKQTVWANFSSGKIEIEEICYYSVEGQCKNEAIGCKRLHARNHFHWQIRKNQDWYNLSIKQAISLECAYCDPNKDSSLLERLDLKAPEIKGSDLLNILGTDKWEANFNNMTVSNVSKNGRPQRLRRLCTEYLHNRKVASNTFIWYFIDQNNKCIPYGEVDTTGRTFLKSEVTSKEIEMQYYQYINIPTMNTMIFKNSMFSYKIDFGEMMQTNMSTKVSRKIKRRPMLDKKFIKKSGFKAVGSKLFK